MTAGRVEDGRVAGMKANLHGHSIATVAIPEFLKRGTILT